ncbi:MULTISPECIES: hypothetical protein [unclassified Mesorhizobium]|uniref:hypothetical protein n=1 Tax=unclassified Mesorhizobium TaxID=325217 RepID=UPI000FCB2F0A|nr:MULTISPECIES: hypothetical protein [unclassified Mesorhizobium]RUT88015.1 hypothetical protein EOD14_08255 [Mesorhizobium sp. M7A.T.Ca.US.000.02.1.1]RUT91849.1 hypothetical protein EOD15_13015 [Mesorhizobium sp. M7A.T.Ca.US.000.02.2.1]RUU76436.1 hypothetical protein EOC06_27005 [Mesorhizobium sp. M7A.F.Ca.MR.362.00.0.0]RWN95128.1 MAG: hypothetical protein EOS05_10025 [Mesorhizobium sp.]
MTITPHGLVTASTAADARELDRLLRPEDRREVEELGGRPALQHFLLGVLMSEPSFTLRDHDGSLVGIAGVVPDLRGNGVVWMSGTTLVESRKMAFLRGSRDVLAEFHRRFDTLYNICDARNEVHVKWLRWLGFTLLHKYECGPNAVPVYEFARIA